MKLTHRILAGFLAVLVMASTVIVSASAKKFAKKVNTNLGVKTQYEYEENNPSWLRQLTVKENMLSVDGIVTEKALYPVSKYPYTSDAPSFKEEIDEYVEIYTLDEESQKAAYIYVFQQLGALSIIADPEATDQSKADWLREQGVIITKEDEQDPNSILMISALYALWKNDFFYVIEGERITIPPGTKLEAALMMYMVAFGNDERSLLAFVNKYFNVSEIISLEDYVYYTALFALYTNGYVSSREIVTLPRNEVFRRLAIMSISNAGIAIDVNSATDEEVQIKYLAAMLGVQYNVTLDPDSTFKANRNGTVHYYMIQRMAYEDKKITISSSKYTYEQAFDIVLKKTNRFDLDKEFYSDIYEYDLHLDHFRELIYINPTPIDNGFLTVTINDQKVNLNQYAKVPLNSDPTQILLINVQYNGDTKKNTTYRLNVYQGTTPPDDENVTGIISNVGVDIVPNLNNTVTPSYDYLDPTISMQNVMNTQSAQILHINEQGQLVDSQGNVISDSVKESLPEGFGYILGADGIVTIGKLDELTTSPDSSTQSGIDKEQIKTIVIYFSAFLVISATIGGYAYYRMTVKRRRTKSVKKTNKKKNKK